MDLFLYQIRAAYKRNPLFVIAFLVTSAIVGITFGFRFLGPMLFG